ncbi:MAG: hypothetical protein ACQEXJ_22320 [Myxococcota bacterium]
MPPISSPRPLLTAAMAAAVIACTWTSAPARAGTLPSGFPEEITLPEGVASVFLVGEEYEVDESGRRHLVARRYELAQEVRDGDAVRSHFESLFRRLCWGGGFRPAGDGVSGSFEDEDRVSVRVSLKPRPGVREHLRLRVRVDME